VTPHDAIATIPKRIKIGPLVYKVELVETIDDEGSDAEIIHEQLRIRIRSTSPDSAYVAGSLIHELFHGIWDDRGLGDTEDEETVCTSFERGFCMLVQDNPRLITWLKKCLLAGKKIK